ncbi:MAG: DHH family phosphoesterase [Candidatus Hodarchaeota archaeon]
MNRDLDDFLNLTKRAGEKLKEWAEEKEIIRITSHYDADGIAAAGIIGLALLRLDATFHIRIVKQATPKIIKELADENRSSYVFSDLGCAQLDSIKRYLSESSVIVLDHHEIRNTDDFPGLLHVNPHLCGINGGREISGAGVSYLMARSINRDNRDLAHLAVVGAVGDIQDKAEHRGFIGINGEIIVKDGMDAGVLKVEKDLSIFGRETRPIHVALQYTTDPFIPGLTGSEERCFMFLSKAGIKLKDDDHWRTLSDLSQDEKIQLNSALIQYMLQQGIDPDKAQSIVGNVYTLIREEKGTPLRDAREFASLLNACGRIKHPGVGVAICLGDRINALEEAQKLLAEYRQKISKYIEWLTQPGRIRETEFLQVFHGEDVIDERIVGTVASVALYAQILKSDKIIVSFAYSDPESVKVSLRADAELVGKGVNLGLALSQVIEEIELKDATAGGHDAAAGALIPSGTEEKLVFYLEKIIKNQMEDKKREKSKQN